MPLATIIDKEGKVVSEKEIAKGICPTGGYQKLQNGNFVKIQDDERCITDKVKHNLVQNNTIPVAMRVLPPCPLNIPVPEHHTTFVWPDTKTTADQLFYLMYSGRLIKNKDKILMLQAEFIKDTGLKLLNNKRVHKIEIKRGGNDMLLWQTRFQKPRQMVLMNDRILVKIKQITIDLRDLNPESHKHFSFLVIRNRIISVGMNSMKTTHPLTKGLGYKSDFLHSELDAFLAIRWQDINYNKCVLVNTRINRFLQFGMSKPCDGCMNLLNNIGIKNIIYTDRAGTWQYHNL